MMAFSQRIPKVTYYSTDIVGICESDESNFVCTKLDQLRSHFMGTHRDVSLCLPSRSDRIGVMLYLPFYLGTIIDEDRGGPRPRFLFNKPPVFISFESSTSYELSFGWSNLLSKLSKPCHERLFSTTVESDRQMLMNDEYLLGSDAVFVSSPLSRGEWTNFLSSDVPALLIIDHASWYSKHFVDTIKHNYNNCPIVFISNYEDDEDLDALTSTLTHFKVE